MDFYLKNPKLVVLLGHPLGHTFSPRIHNLAFKLLGLDYVYTVFPIEPDKFAHLDLKNLPIVGGNVTIPYKEKVIAKLDFISESSGNIGAVNTFYKKNGILKGDNTDYYGFMKSLEGFENYFVNKEVLLLGTGGSSKAVLYALNKLKVKKVCVVSRELETANTFINSKIEQGLNLEYQAFNFSTLTLYSQLKNISMVINTTPVGMKDSNSPLNESTLNGLKDDILVYDLIYNPLKTELLKRSENKGFKIKNGLEMLVYQAEKAFEHWTQEQFPTKDIFEYLTEFKYSK